MVLMRPRVQMIAAFSWEKSEFLCREVELWDFVLQGERRLSEAQEKLAALNTKVTDLRLRCVDSAMEAREKLATLLEQAHKSEEEAAKVRAEWDALLQASREYATTI